MRDWWPPEGGGRCDQVPSSGVCPRILLCDPAPLHPFVSPIPDGTLNSSRHRTASSPSLPLVPGGLERTRVSATGA